MNKKLSLKAGLVAIIFSVIYSPVFALSTEDFTEEELAYIDEVWSKGSGMILNNQISVKNQFCASSVGFAEKICIVSNMEMLAYFGDVCQKLGRSFDDSCPGEQNKGFINLTKRVIGYANNERAMDIVNRCIEGNSVKTEMVTTFTVLSRSGGEFTALLFSKPRNFKNINTCLDVNLGVFNPK